MLMLQCHQLRLRQVGDGCGGGIEQHEPQLTVQTRIRFSQALAQIRQEGGQLVAKRWTDRFHHDGLSSDFAQAG
jgi:hypothetical protein